MCHESARHMSYAAVSQKGSGSCSAKRGFAPGLPLVLSFRSCAYRRCLPLRTLTSLCRSAFLLRTVPLRLLWGFLGARVACLGTACGADVASVHIPFWFIFMVYLFIFFNTLSLFSLSPLSLSGSFSLSRLSLSVPMGPYCASGLVVDYIVLIAVARVRFHLLDESEVIRRRFIGPCA